MFDQSRNTTAYAFDFSDEPDKEVVDAPEPPPIARGRVPTGDLTVHVVHENRRHRRLPDLSGTSCGKRYHSGFASVFREELTHRDGRLCEDGCFTPYELAIADREERQRMGEP